MLERRSEMKLKFVKAEIAVLPDEYASLFYSYSEVVCDTNCGEPIGWGFKPKHHLGDETFGEVGVLGMWECLEIGNWVLVVRKLKPSQAIKEYGKITKLIIGPQGGFRSVTYGDSTFNSDWLNPRKKHSYRVNGKTVEEKEIDVSPSLIEVLPRHVRPRKNRPDGFRRDH
jgi:hypothetical protein